MVPVEALTITEESTAVLGGGPRPPSALLVLCYLNSLEITHIANGKTGEVFIMIFSRHLSWLLFLHQSSVGLRSETDLWRDLHLHTKKL